MGRANGRPASSRNLGGEPLPPEDRKDVAEYLDKARQWPMEDLAKSLGVSNSTISTDLADSDISHMGNADDRKDSLGRKASLGRPRATGALVERGTAGSG